MAGKFRVEGLKELDKALGELSKSAGKGALRRALKTSAEPLARKMRQGAPRDDYDLIESIDVSTKLSPRQAIQHRKMFASDKASVEMFVGAGPLPQAHLQEFGTWFHPPQPWARPAWDQDQKAILDRLKVELWSEVSKAVGRAQRKAARQALKG